MKILVHLHLYYQNMLDEMIALLQNIDNYNYDLYVTIVKEDFEIVKKLKLFRSNAKIIIVENKGFDVFPFLIVLNAVNLQDYDYVIKMHTKRNMSKGVVLHGKYYIASGSYWREKLLCFLESEECFKTAIELLRNDSVGMISHYKLIDDEIGECNESRALELLKETGLPSLDKKFVMGTMFICKAELLNPLKSLKLREFENSDSLKIINSKRDGSLAHVYERLFGWIICAQNKKIIPLYHPSIKDKILNYLIVKISKYKKYIVR